MAVPTRRELLKGVLALPVAGLAAGLGGRVALAATPACPDPETPTPDVGAGPFYRPQSPPRTSFLEAGLTGTPLAVTGRVLGTDGRLLPGTLLDFWHCDARGRYDMQGHRFRGHQLADGEGRFRLDTLLPAAYVDRTPHIHAHVQRPGGEVLATTLYLSDRPGSRDGRFPAALVLELVEQDGGRRGRFDFVLRV